MPHLEISIIKMNFFNLFLSFSLVFFGKLEKIMRRGFFMQFFPLTLGVYLEASTLLYFSRHLSLFRLHLQN